MWTQFSEIKVESTEYEDNNQIKVPEIESQLRHKLEEFLNNENPFKVENNNKNVLNVENNSNLETNEKVFQSEDNDSDFDVNEPQFSDEEHTSHSKNKSRLKNKFDLNFGHKKRSSKLRERYICDQIGCEKRFNKRENLILHKKLHLGSGLECGWNGCQFKAKSVDSLKSHQNNRHSGLGSYISV